VTPARTQESPGYQAPNPYGSTQPSQGYGNAPPSQPYSTAAQATPPYGNTPQGGYSNSAPVGQGYGAAPEQYGSKILSASEYRSDISSIQTAIKTLSSQIAEIATLHQNALSSTTTGPSAQLEHKVTQTQLLNSRIKDDIKRLEKDAVNTPSESERKIKQTQIGSVKNGFEGQLTAYRKEEEGYRRRYQDQIARQYRIVNPDADESEVREAANADWGNEGVFQSAVS
jgi:syntaxin 1B/2/3